MRSYRYFYGIIANEICADNLDIQFFNSHGPNQIRCHCICHGSMHNDRQSNDPSDDINLHRQQLLKYYVLKHNNAKLLMFVMFANCQKTGIINMISTVNKNC